MPVRVLSNGEDRTGSQSGGNGPKHDEELDRRSASRPDRVRCSGPGSQPRRQCTRRISATGNRSTGAAQQTTAVDWRDPGRSPRGQRPRESHQQRKEQFRTEPTRRGGTAPQSVTGSIGGAQVGSLKRRRPSASSALEARQSAGQTSFECSWRPTVAGSVAGAQVGRDHRERPARVLSPGDNTTTRH